MGDIQKRFIFMALTLLLGCDNSINSGSGTERITELEGKWYGNPLNLTVNRSHFQLEGDSNSMWLKGDIILNTVANPKGIDLKITDGSDTSRIGKTYLGIYKTQNDSLIIEVNSSADSARPVDFNMQNGALLIFSRDSIIIVPPVLNTPINNSSHIFMLTYFNEPGCQPPTADNPYGLHKGIDFAGLRGTAIITSVPGTVTSIQYLSGTASNGHTVVLERVNGGFTLNYNLEPADSIFVILGQELQIGDTIGLLGDCGIAIGYMGSDTTIPNPTIGYGILDFRAIDRSKAFTCLTPLATPQFKGLMEELFNKNFTVTTDTPGPCTCHYHYP